MTSWIDAKVKMPEQDGRYLVVENDNYNWVGVSSVRNGVFDMSVLYWQPLPEIPKVNNKNETQ